MNAFNSRAYTSWTWIAIVLSLGAITAVRLSGETMVPVYATIDEAIARGDLDDVTRHVRRDPESVNGKPGAKMAPLHQAILRRKPEIVSFLLAHGANVHAADSSQRTPLHLAVERGDAAIVKELLTRKADPMQRDRIGWTPLHHAAAKTRIEIAALLLDSGMNPNVLSELGGTALHEAAASGNAEMVSLLLARGVDPTIRSKPGVTALDLAREYKHPEIVEVLGVSASFPLIGTSEKVGENAESGVFTGRYFECVEDDGAKFWAVDVTYNEVVVRFGRAATRGQEQRKTFTSAEAALRERDRLIESKQAKGYVEKPRPQP